MYGPLTEAIDRPITAAADPVLVQSVSVTGTDLRPHWYAASTVANHEKGVAAQLSAHLVEHFLPTYESVRQWKDRRVRLHLPLFPGYVFVRLKLCDRLRVLQISSVARLVSFSGAPAALPDTEIETLRAGLAQGVQAVPHSYLKIGRRVRVIDGPLQGLEGIVIRQKNQLRLVITLDTIQRSIRLDIDASSVELLQHRRR